MIKLHLNGGMQQGFFIFFSTPLSSLSQEVHTGVKCAGSVLLLEISKAINFMPVALQFDLNFLSF